MTTLIDGKSIARSIREGVKEKVEVLVKEKKRVPKLAVILVGDDPASEIYVQHKERACLHAGILSETIKIGKDATEQDTIQSIHKLNQDESVDGILLQLPLPKGIDRVKCVSEISPHKDVDGITPHNEGMLVWRYPALYPCTPLGIVRLIKSVEPNLSGKVAAVIGRSALVGLPVGILLENEGCSVLGLHSESLDCAKWTRQADIVVVATGVHHLVGPDWINENSIVIDVGIHRVGSKIEGDVDFEKVFPKCHAISPVPGGVGPMTIAMLVSNCLEAYQNREASLLH